ncbi:hypothetical protein GQ457_10G002590 [Hibiscus cannabinus]
MAPGLPPGQTNPSPPENPTVSQSTSPVVTSNTSVTDFQRDNGQRHQGYSPNVEYTQRKEAYNHVFPMSHPAVGFQSQYSTVQGLSHQQTAPYGFAQNLPHQQTSVFQPSHGLMQGVSTPHVMSHSGYPVTSSPGFYPSGGVQCASPTTPTSFSSSAGGVSTSSNNVGFVSGSAKSVDAVWYPDSGATHHITNDTSTLHSGTMYKGNDHLLMGNGSEIQISQTRATLLEGTLTPEGLYKLEPPGYSLDQVQYQACNVSKQLLHSDTQAGSPDDLCHDTRPQVVSQGDVLVTNEEAGLHRSAGGQVSPNQFQGFSDRRTGVVCSSREVPLELSDMPSQVAFTTAEGVESRASDSEMVEEIPIQLAATDSSTRVNDGLPSDYEMVEEIPVQFTATDSSTRVNDGLPEEFDFEAELQNQAEAGMQSQTEEEAVDFSHEAIQSDQSILQNVNNTVNIHPMVTQGKNGIRKPKVYQVEMLPFSSNEVVCDQTIDSSRQDGSSGA